MSTPLAPTDLPTTLGALRASNYQPKSVREEIRANLEQRLADGLPLTSDVLGYEDTVLPQLETALLAGHDIILLGERGQAKTRMIRSLVDLLDEWLPIVEGSEIRDDPFACHNTTLRHPIPKLPLSVTTPPPRPDLVSIRDSIAVATHLLQTFRLDLQDSKASSKLHRLAQRLRKINYELEYLIAPENGRTLAGQ